MKRSGGNSRRLPDAYTYFLERPLGKKVGLALRELGLKVVLHLEVFKDDAADEDYLTRCAKEGWIPLTADSDVNLKVNQRVLIFNAGLRVFRLTRNHWPWSDKLDAFLRAAPKMGACLDKRPAGPFIARIDRHGKIVAFDDMADLKAKATKEKRGP